MTITTSNPVNAFCVLTLVACFIVTASAQSPVSAPTNWPVSHVEQRTQQCARGSQATPESKWLCMTTDEKMAMARDPDQTFAVVMKMHFQQGILLAQAELANGKSEAMKAMASRIIAAQTKESADFDKWLSKRD